MNDDKSAHHYKKKNLSRTIKFEDNIDLNLSNKA